VRSNSGLGLPIDVTQSPSQPLTELTCLKTGGPPPPPPPGGGGGETLPQKIGVKIPANPIRFAGAQCERPCDRSPPTWIRGKPDIR